MKRVLILPAVIVVLVVFFVVYTQKNAPESSVVTTLPVTATTTVSTTPYTTTATDTTTTAVSTQEYQINSVRLTNKKMGILFPFLSDYLTETRDDFHYFVISALKLRATMTNDVSTDAVMQTLIPSYKNEDYNIYKNENNESGDHFTVGYDLKIGEYVTNKGYTVIYDENQATLISESFISFSSDSVDVSKLPIVTDEIMETAYKQAQEETSAKHSGCFILKQEGEPYFDIEENECYFRVKTTYSVDAMGQYKGVFHMKYRIS
jgi:hypothetical protein